jgi:hypothetical protein
MGPDDQGRVEFERLRPSRLFQPFQLFVVGSVSDLLGPGFPLRFRFATDVAMRFPLPVVVDVVGVVAQIPAAELIPAMLESGDSRHVFATSGSGSKALSWMPA